MAHELSNDTVDTSVLGPNARLFGASSSDATEPTSYGREAILNYITAALSPVASSGSADYLTSGTLPLGRLHAHLADISSIPAFEPGGLMYYGPGGHIVALEAGPDGYVLKARSGGELAWDSIASLAIGENEVTNLTLRDSAGLSVIGRSANSTGDPGDIAGTEGQILRVASSVLGFGQIDLASTAAVTGALAVTNGGTGGSTTSAARTALGLAIGSDIQGYDATLAALAGVSTSADTIIYATGSDTFSTTALTATARTLLDDASTSAMRTTLGLAIGSDVQAFDADLSALAALGSTGVAVRTGAATWAQRTITGTANEISVTDGDGVGGNPTLALPSSITLTGKTLTGGTITGATITGLANPSASTDAANKDYVDNIAQGLSPKDAVACATTANITLSGEQTLDGVLTSTSRVLVKNQTAPAENGIYVSAAGAWSRATDMNTWAEVVGAFVYTTGGTTQAATGWVCTSTSGGTLGSTAVTWTQFSAAGSYTAGTGLQLSGSQFSVSDAELLAIAGLTSAADRLPYFTGSGTASLATFTSTARSLLDDASTSAMRTTLGLTIGTDVQAYNAGLADIAGLAKTDSNIIVGNGTNWVAESGATARTSLGLTIGTDVQAYDAELAAIAGLVSAADRLPYFTGVGTAALATFTSYARTLLATASAAAARTALGLGRETLAANRTYYVRTDGSDSNTGLTDSSGGAFLTIQQAYDTIAGTLDLAGFTVTVQVKNGTFAALSVTQPWTGGGAVIIQGDTATPANVTISSATFCVAYSAVLPGRLTVRGFTLTSSGASCLYAANTGTLAFNAIAFSSASQYHIHADAPGAAIVAAGNYSITGNATIHATVSSPGAKVDLTSYQCTIATARAFSYFVYASRLGAIIAFGWTTTGAGVAGTTGQRYYADGNGVVHTGSGSGTFFPGNVAGATSTGGQYL